jgi:hypothetical protein
MVPLGMSVPFPTGTSGLSDGGASGPGRCAMRVLNGAEENGVTMI